MGRSLRYVCFRTFLDPSLGEMLSRPRALALGLAKSASHVFSNKVNTVNTDEYWWMLGKQKSGKTKKK